MEQLLKGVLNMALKVEALPVASIQRVTVDTTVQEKAIAFPTVARLYHNARRALVRAARTEGLKLRQTSARASSTSALRVMLGRVIRDVQRKRPEQPEQLEQATQTSTKLERVLAIADRIYTQQRHDLPKLYSVHAPEVECIAKGKVQKRYEFGCKVAPAVTSQVLGTPTTVVVDNVTLSTSVGTMGGSKFIAKPAVNALQQQSDGPISTRNYYFFNDARIAMRQCSGTCSAANLGTVA